MFDVHLVYALDPPAPAQAQNPAPALSAPDPAGPSVFSAIQNQLGLKLAPGKGNVDVLVIDHIEKPTAN